MLNITFYDQAQAHVQYLHGPVQVEVETQALEADGGALLGHVAGQHLLQRGLQQVGGCVVAARAPPHFGVHRCDHLCAQRMT